MKYWILGAAIAASLANAASAQSAPAAQGSPWSQVVTFDSPLPNGFSLNGGQIVHGNGPGYAAPAGDDTNYLTTGIGSASLTADQDYRSVGFYWGSIDAYNSVSLLDAAGNLIAAFTGADFPPATGDQTSAATNRWVTYTLDPASLIAGIRTIVFSSSGFSMEVDTIAFGGPGSPAPVPEPATIGLFGIGLAAMARYRRRRKAATA